MQFKVQDRRRLEKLKREPSLGKGLGKRQGGGDLSADLQTLISNVDTINTKQ